LSLEEGFTLPSHTPLNTPSFAKNVTALTTNHTGIKQNWQTFHSKLISSLRTRELSSHHDPDQTFHRKSHTEPSGKPHTPVSLMRKPILSPTVKDTTLPLNISIAIGIKYNSLTTKANHIGLYEPVTCWTQLHLSTPQITLVNQKLKTVLTKAKLFSVSLILIHLNHSTSHPTLN